MSDSDKTNELDNYGVWVKKPPRTVSSEIESDLPDFSAAESIDDTAFDSGDTALSADELANLTGALSEEPSPAVSGDTEEISLDEFIEGGVFEGDDTASSPAAEESSAPAPAQEESVSLDDFMDTSEAPSDIAVSDEPTISEPASLSVDDGPIDIDLSFDDSAPSIAPSEPAAAPVAAVPGSEEIDLSDFGVDFGDSGDAAAPATEPAASDDGAESVDLSDFGVDFSEPSESPAAEESTISLTETEVQTTDENGEEIYLDIPLTRAALNEIIEPKVTESVEKVREVIGQSNLNPTDFENIVFVGGPTNYKPLRNRICEELAIPGKMYVNPMTAVAEGAAIFAESIDWTSENHHRKNVRESINFSGDAVAFNYIARTSDEVAKVAVQVKENLPFAAEFQIDSLDTGETSGKMPLTNGKIVPLKLTQKGANRFKIIVFDNYGSPVKEENITVDRVAATITAIPASHSIGVEVLTGINQKDSKLEWLVRVGDSLPQKGTKTFKAAQTIRANSPQTFNFKLWEGEIEFPVTDNRFIGVFSVGGKDIADGVIPKGADLICEYEMLDSGNIEIEISIPVIGSSFKADHNFYSRQEGAVDYSDENELDTLINDGEEVLQRISNLEDVVDSEKLQRAREKAEAALDIRYSDNPDAEPRQEAADNIYAAKKLLYEVRRENLTDIRKF